MGILYFVDKDQLERGCAILMHNKVIRVLGFSGFDSVVNICVFFVFGCDDSECLVFICWKFEPGKFCWHVW